MDRRLKPKPKTCTYAETKRLCNPVGGAFACIEEWKTCKKTDAV